MVPVMVLVTLVVVQFALVWHGRHLAQAAAQAGVTAAHGVHTDPGAARGAAGDYLDQVAPHLLTDRTITAAVAGGTVTVTVTAHVETILPFADLSITATAAGPVETFTAAP